VFRAEWALKHSHCSPGGSSGSMRYPLKLLGAFAFNFNTPYDSPDIGRGMLDYEHLWGNPHFETTWSRIAGAEQPSPLPKLPCLGLLNHSPPGMERGGVTAPVLQNRVGSWTFSPAHTARARSSLVCRLIPSVPVRKPKGWEAKSHSLA